MFDLVAMQIREDSFKGDRPPCPKRGPNCKNKPHCNGHYLRYANPDESQPSLKIFCFWCVPCRVSISVIPVNHLPYWSIEVDPLAQYFDLQPSGDIDSLDFSQNTLLRAKGAWKRFCSRSSRFVQILGQLIAPLTPSIPDIWMSIGRLEKSFSALLNRLAYDYRISLLGDYPRLFGSILPT